MELTCGKCQISKPLLEFHKNSARKSGFSAYCKDCVRQYHQGWRAKNPEEAKRRNREANRKFDRSDAGKTASRRKNAKRYGLTLEQYDEVLARNSGLCAICNERAATCLDHCHLTLTVRGGLCTTCNKGLGLFYDRIDLLQKAIEYLAVVSPHPDKM